MRFGNWRGVTLALGIGCVVATMLSSTASAQGFFHPTIPPLAPAYNVNTGEPFRAPPVPYGHYAKDPVGGLHSAVGGMKAKFGAGLFHHGNGCDNCGGAGCGLCKHGLFGGHRGACGSCGGAGCGLCKGGGLFGGHGGACGNCGGAGCGLCVASAQSVTHAPKTLPSAQACGACGGAGCGLCNGRGLHFGSHGNSCGNCGGAGCGLCHGGRGAKCHNCGGAGCNECGGHGKLDPSLLFTSLLHRGKRIQYFVGAGGPVPLTPGYVPYVVPVRSPRDYFAFPPFSPDAP
jgi:hypothetical protein